MKNIIQDVFLKMLVENNEPVAVYLRHGIKLTGKILWFNQKIIFLENSDGSTQLVFIDSVSTVTPLFNF